jgi:hypothetical protein
MDTTGKRLTAALEDWAQRHGTTPDKKAFQLAMKRRLGGPYTGVSYPVVLGYFSDRTTPSLDWIEAAAAELGVPLGWLAFGQGPRSYAEMGERNEAATLDAQRVRRAVFDAARQELSALWPVGVDGIDAMLMAAVPQVATWIGSHGAAIRDFADGMDQYAEAGHLLGRAIAAPLQVLHIDPEQWPDTQMGHVVRAQYVTQVMGALMPLLDLAFTQSVRQRHAGNEEGVDNA